MSRIMATVYDWVMRPTEEACLQDWRAALLQDVHGRVVEIGAGTGANLGHYPRAVDELVLTEPDPHMRDQLWQALPEGGGSVRVVDAPAERLPFDDATVDWVVSTLVLCSVGDPRATLAEIRRVLVPGGGLVFLEHVAAEEGSPRRRWQGWIEPVWRPVAGNCHLTRRTEQLLDALDFRIERIQRESMRRALPFVRPTIRGVARVGS